MEHESGVTMLNNIIENIEQRGHENILQFRFHCINEQLFLLILDSFPVHKRIRNKVRRPPILVGWSVWWNREPPWRVDNVFRSLPLLRRHDDIRAVHQWSYYIPRVHTYPRAIQCVGRDKTLGGHVLHDHDYVDISGDCW